MRFCWAAILFPLAAFSQDSQTGALMGGVLLERDASEFSIRAADSRVFRYRYNGDTYVHRGNEMIDMPRLALGERVEVISEKVEGPALRFAITVHALPPEPPPRQYRASSAAEERPLPLNSFSLTGLVYRIVPGAIALHTRTGDRGVILRPDTRFLEDGAVVDPSALKLNMHVSIQAGKTLYDEIEAFRVVWGSILRP